MELVYFISPACDANCVHCWSHDMLMGRMISLEKHYSIIDNIDIEKYSKVKISGGEPFLNKDLSDIVKYMRNKWGRNIPISIFTSGRQLLDENMEVVKKNIIDQLGIFDNICLELSVDEYHVEVLKDKYVWEQCYIEKMKLLLENFFNAYLCIQKEYDSTFLIKFKMHCAQNRKDYHLNYLYKWMPEEWWEKFVILTEGLANAGNARVLDGTFNVIESEMVSHFLFPGVSFQDKAISKNAVKFYDEKGDYCFLDDNSSVATIIEGWWNVIDRIAKYYEIIIK